MPLPACRDCGDPRPADVLASSHCPRCRTRNPYAPHLEIGGSPLSLPTVTRRDLPSGMYRYEVDGEVHTAKSRRLYSHASVYVRTQDSQYGRKGQLAVFLHARSDLAVKGAPDANRIVKWGGMARVPGVAVISAAD